MLLLMEPHGIIERHSETQSDLFLGSLSQIPSNCGCFLPCLLLLTFSPFLHSSCWGLGIFSPFFHAPFTLPLLQL